MHLDDSRTLQCNVVPKYLELKVSKGVALLTY